VETQVKGVSFFAVYSIVPLLLLTGLVVLAFVAVRAQHTRARPSRGPIWAGGERYARASMQYTGSAFSALIWQPQARAVPTLPTTPLPSDLQPAAGHHVTEWFSQLTNRIIGGLLAVSTSIGNQLQGGDIRRYLAYIFLVFVIILLAFLLRQGGV